MRWGRNHRQRDAIGGKTRHFGLPLTKWDGVSFIHYPSSGARLPRRGKMATTIKERR